MLHLNSSNKWIYLHSLYFFAFISPEWWFKTFFSIDFWPFPPDLLFPSSAWRHHEEEDDSPLFGVNVNPIIQPKFFQQKNGQRRLQTSLQESGDSADHQNSGEFVSGRQVKRRVSAGESSSWQQVDADVEIKLWVSTRIETLIQKCIFHSLLATMGFRN